MSFVLKIDYREQDLVETFGSLDPLDFQKDSLDLGDIVFEYEDVPIIVIERKKMMDLSSSLYDGRYKEQKKRIKKALHKNVRKVYLIEGSTSGLWKTKMSGKTFVGVKINTMLRDNIHVVHVNGYDDTVRFIKDIYTRLEKYVKDIYGEVIESEDNSCYSEVVCNVTKKKNMTPDVYKVVQFQQIPQVSNTVAKLIVEKVGSLKDILLKYQTEEEKVELKKEISELRFGDKQRRVGVKLAERVIEFIYY